jgi:hypothetical protein
MSHVRIQRRERTLHISYQTVIRHTMQSLPKTSLSTNATNEQFPLAFHRDTFLGVNGNQIHHLRISADRTFLLEEYQTRVRLLSRLPYGIQKVHRQPIRNTPYTVCNVATLIRYHPLIPPAWPEPKISVLSASDLRTCPVLGVSTGHC